MTHEGQTTGPIDFLGNNSNLEDAQNIANAFAPLNTTVNVEPAVGAGDSAEVQRIEFTANAGTFQLAHAGLITGDITFAGLGAANGLTTATNIQDALNASCEHRLVESSLLRRIPMQTWIFSSRLAELTVALTIR